jgi:hypothetical protein
MREIECDGCGRLFACQILEDTACWCAALTVRLQVPQSGSGNDCRCSECIMALEPTGEPGPG